MGWVIDAIEGKSEPTRRVIEVSGIADIGDYSATHRSSVAVWIISVLRCHRAAGSDDLGHTAKFVLHVVVRGTAGDHSLGEVLGANRRTALGIIMGQAAHRATPAIGMIGSDGSAGAIDDAHQTA